MSLVGHAQNGLWPVGGGLLDQCRSFVDLYTITVNYESQYYANKAKQR